MSFQHAWTKGDPSPNRPIPAGEYVLRIVDTTESVSKNSGRPQVIVHFRVHDGQYKGRSIKYHRVTFIPEDCDGAGMAVHFLKCIGEPWENKYEVNHMHWRGKLLKAKVIEEEYNGYVNNKIVFVNPVEDYDAFKKSHAGIENETVPF